MSRDLPEGIEILPGTDVDGAWERFEVFEALHHAMRICNPMSPDDLDGILAGLDPAPGDRVLDVACGHGELLIRAAERTGIAGAGIDLSPWALRRAHREAARRVPEAGLHWILGDGKALGRQTWDVLTCLGASWIWNGFAGTVRAMAARTIPGSRVAIGDLVLKPGADATAVADVHGHIPDLAEQASVLEAAGFGDPEPVVVPDAAFDGYYERVEHSARTWAGQHPGEASERYLAQQRSWAEDHRRDRWFLSWVVWVGHRAGT